MSSKSESRTSKSLTNAKVSLFFMILTFIVNFISRKYSLDYLGPEIVGMRSTIGTILSLLSLSDLGIGSSVGLSLFKPLQEKNYTEVNEIISLQGWLYKRIFAGLTVAILIVMGLVPMLFDGMKAPMIYVYLTLVIYYIGSMGSFTINYKSIIIAVDQKGYILNRFTSTLSLVKIIVQLFIIKYVSYEPYLFWLLADFLGVVLGMYIVNRITEKYYPWLSPNTSKGKEYFKKYPQVFKLVGQVFIYNLAGMITSSMNPFVISQVVGLVSVALYDNYKNLITNIRAIVYSLFSNMVGGIASLIAEEDERKSYTFFWDMVSLKFLVAGVAAFGFLNFSSPLVSLWLGGQYILPITTIIVMVALAYIDLSRWSVDAYINGYKLFQDSWSPIAQSIIYLTVAIICGRIYGFVGVLIGDLVGTIAIVVLWKPYNLYHNGFKRSVMDYWKGILKFPIVGWALILLFTWGVGQLQLNMRSWLMLGVHIIWITPIFTILLWVIYYLISSGFRRMTARLYAVAFNATPCRIRPFLPSPAWFERRC